MFEIPGSDIGGVHVTADAVKRKEAPIYTRGQRQAHPYTVEQEEENHMEEVQLKST